MKDEGWGWTLEIVKGGRGSGHWGHAGRPPQEGGSLPGVMGGSGRVNARYFTEGPGRHIIASLTASQKRTAIAVLTNLRVQPRHISGLKAIKTTIPPDDEEADFENGGDWTLTVRQTGEEIHFDGIYTMPAQEIHVQEHYLEPSATRTGIVEFPLSELVGGLHVFAHEFGHHVSLGSAWAAGGGMKRLESVLKRWAKREFEGGGELSRSTIDALVHSGLHPYSISNAGEFAADIWKVYQFGNDGQRRNLSQMLGVQDLEEIFQ